MKQQEFPDITINIHPPRATEKKRMRAYASMICAGLIIVGIKIMEDDNKKLYVSWPKRLTRDGKHTRTIVNPKNESYLHYFNNAILEGFERHAGQITTPVDRGRI
jgi:DNA-binding cell septation regulator SpoVG